MTKLILPGLLSFFYFSCSKSDADQCCNGTGKILREHSSLIAIPDMFTPNGDGINDVFTIFFTNVSGVNLKIRNKHNKIVFETTDLSVYWDGKKNGKQLKDGNYEYELDATTDGGNVWHYTGKIGLICNKCVKGDITKCFFASQFNGSYFDSNLPSGEHQIEICN